MMEPLAADGFLKMFTQMESFKGHMQVVAQVYMDQLPCSVQAIRNIKKQARVEFIPAMEKVEENLARIERIMKCINCAWVLGLDIQDPMCPDDVLALANHKGKAQPEMTLKELCCLLLFFLPQGQVTYFWGQQDLNELWSPRTS